jgi:malonyl-CoA O-methyltransferase
VLGHVPDLDAAYVELARVCARGGRIVVTDFHPDAVEAGHRRTFRGDDGVVREIEHHVHTPREHRRAAARAGLTLVHRFDRAVGDTVRGFYERAGRLDAYEQQRGLAVVLALAYLRA